VLGPAERQDLQSTIAHKLLQIAVDGSQADIWQSSANLQKDLIRIGMGSFVLNGFPYDFQLPGISLFLLQGFVSG
jgi:hypothetical protein